MNIISRHIKHLLVRNGVAAVPGLGTFILVDVPAAYDESSRVFSAPTVSVSFNYQPGLADDDITPSVARAVCIDVEEANAIVLREVDSIIDVLTVDGDCPLQGVGRLTLSKNSGEMLFEADPSVMNGNNRSWLPSLDIEPIVIRKTEKVEEEPAEVRHHRESMLRSLRITTSSAAALALFVLIAFFSAHFPNQRESEPTTASLGIEQIGKAQAETKDEIVPEASKALVIVLNTPADGVSVVEPREKRASSAFVAAESAKYCLVVASLASRTEAEEFIGNASSSLALLEKDDRYRVYAASGSTIDEVKDKAEVEGLYKKYPSAWICRK